MNVSAVIGNTDISKFVEDQNKCISTVFADKDKDKDKHKFVENLK